MPETGVTIQSYGSMMEQIGAAQQRWLDQQQSSAGGSSGVSAFLASLQSQQGGTTSPASLAGSAAATTASTAQAATSSATATVPGQSPHGVTQTQSHAHHRHHGGGTGAMITNDSLSTLLGSQESGGAGTDEVGTSGLLASIGSAVTQAVSSYFSQSGTATSVAGASTSVSAATNTNGLANALTA